MGVKIVVLVAVFFLVRLKAVATIKIFDIEIAVGMQSVLVL